MKNNFIIMTALILLLIVTGVYLGLKTTKVDDSSKKVQDIEEVYLAISELNETKCKEFEGDYQAKCIEDIYFVLNANKSEDCFSKDADVESRIRYECIKYLNKNIKENEQN